MKNHFYRIISLFLTVLMLIPMITAMGFTVSAETNSGTCGENLTWTLDNEGTLTVSGTGDMFDYDIIGNVSPWGTDIKKVVIGPGVTSIGAYAFSSCYSLISADIGDDVVSIGRSAFCMCLSLKELKLSNSLKTIGYDGFSCCESLRSVVLPDSVTELGDYAFDQCIYLDYIKLSDNLTTIGEYAFCCTSLDSLELPDSLTIIGMAAFKWVDSFSDVVIPSGVTRIESETFNGCDGLYNITIPNSVTYIAKDAFYGCYSYLTIICYPGSCAEEYAIENNINIKYLAPYLVADGVTVTVKNLYGVKDYFIAKGEYTTYSDVKVNRVVQITKNKIGTNQDYTYILSEPGTYTVCIRYDDTTRKHEFITFEVTVNEPTFTLNGFQLKIDNLEGVKVIRTAYGEYYTPGEVKRAEASRSFTAKYIKDTSNYTIQYREEGVVTVAVVYNNGYEVMYTYNVTKKSPTMTQHGNTVTFGNLDDLKVIRYAKGEYTTSNQIKNAAGSFSIQGYKIETETYSVTLKPGTYTFCVQYNDESYNYFVVTVE
ncbi:MAG: leucine-rich repeat domain-containing protein [Clostridia bacterium]|nr:leucine-rich repeat domain-containing protein [Clostridia bacterium]